jgi:hypothetical protein
MISTAWLVRRARIAHAQWNQEHPEQMVAWEWVEEALTGWRYWQAERHTNGGRALCHRERYEEFAGKLPRELLLSILPEAP